MLNRDGIEVRGRSFLSMELVDKQKPREYKKELLPDYATKRVAENPPKPCRGISFRELAKGKNIFGGITIRGLLGPLTKELDEKNSGKYTPEGGIKGGKENLGHKT